MTDVTSKIAYLDGIRLHRALVAGIREVIARQDYLNKINVFPVPDRDTGTNMALTLNAVIEGTYTFYKPDINALLERVADSALNGARGNSGAILAQFFQGFSEGSKNVRKKMTTKNFVTAIATGVNAAHKALSHPKEGTILTVMRDFSNALTQQQLENDDIDFVDLFKKGLEEAQHSLDNTVNQLKSLKKAGVVDAGAQGLVDFLNGIYQFVSSGSIDDLKAETIPTPVADIPEEDLKQDVNEKFRYCTECLILGDNIDHNTLRHELDPHGSSLIVAGSPKKAKVHVHVNDPTMVFDICRRYGKLTGEKADDMIHQQHSFNQREGTVAILTDSGADFPEGMIADLDIHVVPIVINFGNKSYLDKVSMDSQEFIREMRRNPQAPKTSQPSFGDFHRQYQYLNSHYESTIAIHIPRDVSGTLSASEHAAEKCKTPGNDIAVIDGANVSTGLGLIVRYAAEAAKSGKSQQEVIAAVNAIIPKTQVFAAMPDLSYAVAGGRVSARKKQVVDFLHLTPVIGFNFKSGGKPTTRWLLWGRNNLAEKLVKKVVKHYDRNKTYRFAVTHVYKPELGEAVATLLKENFPNIDSLSVVDCGAALAVHIGLGSVGIAVQEYTIA